MYVFFFGVKKYVVKCRFSWEKICDNYDNLFLQRFYYRNREIGKICRWGCSYKGNGQLMKKVKFCYFV